MQSSAEDLIRATRGSLTAPAGCGKTTTIAEAISKYARGRQLVLTHTNAGVDVLRKRLRELGARSDYYHVETIAGWALRYARAFPSLSGIERTKTSLATVNWSEIYAASKLLVKIPQISDVVKNSYQGCLVDEYQDCTKAQHELVLAIADLMPTRVLGDPLQAIFGFRNEPSVVWTGEVQKHFAPLTELAVPWRWQDAKELGEWLQTARHNILTGAPVDVGTAPAQLKWVQASGDEQALATLRARVCREHAVNTGESVVAIVKWDNQGISIAKKVAGFTAIEAIESKGSHKWVSHIERVQGEDRVEAVFAFAKECFTGVTKQLQAVITNGGKDRQGSVKYPSQLEAVNGILESDNLAHVDRLLQGIRHVSGPRIVRAEAYHTVRRAFHHAGTGAFPSALEALEHVCSINRRQGRRNGFKIFGTTLLVKGLEFDHAIILDADSLKTNELYVALTRGTKSITVLSQSRFLRPKTS